MGILVTPNPDVVFQEVGGESVLLHLGRTRYFGLDEVGTRVWQLLHEHRELEQVTKAMLAEYEVEPDRLNTDLDKLLTDLEARELVSLKDRTSQ